MDLLEHTFPADIEVVADTEAVGYNYIQREVPMETDSVKVKVGTPIPYGQNLTPPEVPPRPADLPRGEFSEIARTVLEARYLKKGEDGLPTESPEDMFWRVAYVIAYQDKHYGASDIQVLRLAREFYEMMVEGYWEPNSPTLMNAGRPLGQLSACFVLPVSDSLSNGRDGIYDTLRSMALVHQSGGGTGFSFSRLRPRGATVRSTTGVASGPVSFISLYDSSTEVVKQGGTRRGANMGVLRCDHPDIREFITCKSDTSKITNFNISVAVTHEFMEAVETGGKYDLIDPATGEKVGEEDAREIFDLVVEGAWGTGEPGMLFLDRANEYNPVPHLGEYEATNPCGEQYLLPFDVCNLGSVNLGRFVLDKDSEDWRDRIYWRGLEHAINTHIHFLDNVIDVNRYPMKEIHDLAQRIRRVGAGVMGYADMLVRLGIPYDSEEALEVANEIAWFFNEACKKASERLAEQRGVFPEWERSIWGPDSTCARGPDGERIRPMRKLRHCNVNTVAPTGTISIFAGCSGGIEPLFAVAFMRNQAGHLMPDVNKDFENLAKTGGWYSKELMRKIAEEGHINFPDVPEDVRRVFRTAHDIAPEWHVKVQAAWQRHIDSSISKTCNFPTEATVEDVKEIFLLAYKTGCKGITVYRDGSRPMQVLSTGATGKVEEDPKEGEDLLAKVKESGKESARGLPKTAKRQRPEVLSGTTRRKRTPHGTLYLTINEDDAQVPFEVFITLGKAGGGATADAEGMGRLVSLALRHGIDLQEIARQLRGISSDRATGFGKNKVLSVPDAIGQILYDYLQDRGVHVDDGDNSGLEEDITGACPECKAELAFTEGCLKCYACGYSAC